MGKGGRGHKMWDFSEKYRNFVEKMKKVVDREKIHPLYWVSLFQKKRGFCTLLRNGRRKSERPSEPQPETAVVGPVRRLEIK